MHADKHPYELLVRWDRDGKIGGAHVQWRYVIKDEDTGETVGETLTPAEPVAVASGKGFPLQDILSRIHSDALIELSEAQAQPAEREPPPSGKTEPR